LIDFRQTDRKTYLVIESVASISYTYVREYGGFEHMTGGFSIIQLILSMLIFLVMFFGIGFLLNMLLRSTWFMAILYPIVVIFIVDDVSFLDYFFKAGTAFSALGHKLVSLQPADILILASGLVGAIISGIVMKILRKMGYQMF